MEKVNCSVQILTLNSEKLLPQCLGSVKNFREIIMLDGNSTDETVEIGKKFGAKIYPQKETKEKNVRIENFSAMRARALSLTTLPWVFELDSDEYISQELEQDMRNILNGNNSSEHIAYRIQRFAIIDGRIIKHAFFYPDYRIRLFNKKLGAYYELGKVVHESVNIPLGTAVKDLKGPVYAHWPSFTEGIKKDNYYLLLFENKMRAKSKGKAFFTRLGMILASFRNILIAVGIFAKAIIVYLRHGFKDSIPFKHNWRFIRHHLIIAYLRLKYIFVGA